MNNRKNRLSGLLVLTFVVILLSSCAPSRSVRILECERNLEAHMSVFSKLPNVRRCMCEKDVDGAGGSITRHCDGTCVLSMAFVEPIFAADEELTRCFCRVKKEKGDPEKECDVSCLASMIAITGAKKHDPEKARCYCGMKKAGASKEQMSEACGPLQGGLNR